MEDKKISELTDVFSEDDFIAFMELVQNSNKTSLDKLLKEIVNSDNPEGVISFAYYIWGASHADDDDIPPPEEVLTESLMAAVILYDLYEDGFTLNSAIEEFKKANILKGGLYALGRFHRVDSLYRIVLLVKMVTITNSN